MKKFLVLIQILLSIFTSTIAQNRGVFIHDKNRVDDAYRLISSRHLTAAHLLRPDGRYVHSWYYAPNEQATSDFGGFGMTWHYAEMLPNGHLLAIIKDEMLLELDWNSTLVWQTKLRAHHDVARLDNGHTIVVSRQDIDNPWKPETRLAMDELVEFDENGQQVWTWRYVDHLENMENLVEQPLPPAEEFRDWPHINTCEVLPENASGEQDARFQAANLLLCGRHSNTIFIVEKQTGDIVWAWGPGELLGPHHPTMLENGNILVYDNGHHTTENSRGYTRILEINPITSKIVWSYAGDPTSSFYSPSRGSNNRLQNGNTLSAESDSGHLFEVTPQGEIVWEYWNSDLRNGQRMPLYRVVPYAPEIVESLFEKYGSVQDVIPEHEENLRFESFGPNAQYKRYIREVVFYTELGYFDHALDFLDLFMQNFPGDPEGYFGYAVVHAAKKNPDKAFDDMIKAVDGGLPLDRFTCGLPGILDPLIKSDKFRDFKKKRNGALAHGPMLGHVTSHSAKFWLRTKDETAVHVQARVRGELDFAIGSSGKTGNQG